MLLSDIVVLSDNFSQRGQKLIIVHPVINFANSYIISFSTHFNINFIPQQLMFGIHCLNICAPMSVFKKKIICICYANFLFIVYCVLLGFTLSVVLCVHSLPLLS